MTTANRTIPTHVGRTFGYRRTRDGRSDHPHARGENPAVSAVLEVMCGPSPRTWGEPASNP